MLPYFLLDFLIGLGALLCQFWFEVEGPRDQKTLKNFLVFDFFAISANLPTRGHMLNLLFNLLFNLHFKTFQQNRPKRLPKSIQKGIQNMMQVGPDPEAHLTSFWPDFWPKLGGKLDPSWPKLGQKSITSGMILELS